MFQNAVALMTTGSQRTALVKLEDEEVHFADPANGYTYNALSHPTAVLSAKRASLDFGAPAGELVG